MLLFNAFDIKTGQTMWLAVPAELLHNKRSIVKVCGIPLSSRFSFYSASSVTMIHPIQP
jgi:hypothetical protein